MLFLAAFPTFLMGLVALRAGETVHVETDQDPPHSRIADGDVVLLVQIYGDLVWPELVVLARVHDLADHFD